jgi:hypothetical protein
MAGNTSGLRTEIGIAREEDEKEIHGLLEPQKDC